MAIYELEQGLGRKPEGYHEFKGRDGWTVRIGLEQTDLWPNDGIARPLPPYGNAYPNLCIDGHPAVGDVDPLQNDFPGLEVHSYALIVPGHRLIQVDRETRGAPFWMNFNGSSEGAVIVSLKGVNPLTLMTARAGLERELIEAWGKRDVPVQNWIPLITRGRDWIDGFPIDPTKMHEEDAQVRQGILTTNPRLGLAQYVIPEEERKKTLSFLFFRPKVWEPPRPKIVTFRGETAKMLGYPSDTLLSRSYGDAKGAAEKSIYEEFEVAAGGLINQKIVRDVHDSEHYMPEPKILVRYYPVTQIQADELRKTMPPKRDAITSMDIPTFGDKDGNG